MEGDLPFNYESIVQIDANYRCADLLFLRNN